MEQPQQRRSTFDVNQTTPLLCEKCGHDTFKELYKWRKVSALISPTGQEGRSPIQVWACNQCGEICVDLVPLELRGLVVPVKLT
jgi:uncharacterized Zn finger protein